MEGFRVENIQRESSKGKFFVKNIGERRKHLQNSKILTYHCSPS